MNETKLKIRTWPDPILRKKCNRVDKVTDDIRDILEEMRILMHIHNGIGLAANQVGLNLALVVCETQGRLLKLVNPAISQMQGQIQFGEGCLSFPGIELTVKRAEKIFVEALNEYGTPIKFWANETTAVVLQHEIDHINGIPFIYRVSTWHRLKVAPMLKELKKKYGLSKPTKK